MKFLPSISLVFFLNSCFQNDSCRPDFIGTFIIDTAGLESRHQSIIQKHSWDTVKLVSDKFGKYYFNTDDSILKQCEGTWRISSNNMERDCLGSIKQKNMKEPINVYSYRISIRIGDSIDFSIPFKKVKP